MKRTLQPRAKAFAAAGITLAVTSGLVVTSIMPAAASTRVPTGATITAATLQPRTYEAVAIENYQAIGRTDGQFIAEHGGPGPYHLLQRTVATGAVAKLNNQFPQVGWAQDYGQQVIMFDALAEENAWNGKIYSWCVYGVYVGPGIARTDPRWFAQAGLPDSPGRVLKGVNPSVASGQLINEPFGQFWSRTPGTCGRAGTPATAPTPQNIRMITARAKMPWLRSELPLQTQIRKYFPTPIPAGAIRG